MTIKEQLIREIEQSSEAYIIKFMQVWQSANQPSTYRDETKLSDFFANHRLPKLLLMGN